MALETHGVELVEGLQGEVLGVQLGEGTQLKIVLGIQGGIQRHIVLQQGKELALELVKVGGREVIKDRKEVNVPNGLVLPHL